LVRDLIQEGGRVLGTQNTLQGMPTLSASWLEARSNRHWLEKGNKHMLSCVFSNKEAE